MFFWNKSCMNVILFYMVLFFFFRRLNPCDLFTQLLGQLNDKPLNYEANCVHQQNHPTQ